eukprot:7377252-Prymnesium_polylepis.1
MEYTTVLSKSMMINTIDSSHGSNAPAGSGAPGAPSPDRVPVNPSEHRVISMKAVGWRGNKQATCAVCGKKVSTCCVKCSTGTVI